MKREIKFRAWDKENEVLMYLDEPETKWEFKENGLTVSYLNEIHYGGGGEIHTKYEWEVLNCDFMQYTVLKDKNGVEIYEGDIVKVKGSKKIGDYISEVVYKRHGFTLKLNKTYLNDDAVLIACIVIGNIHQNPELL